MSGRGIIIAAFFMALVGAGLAFVALSPRNDTQGTVSIVTVQVIVTATPDPNATIPVIIVSATPDRTQVAVPTTIAQSVDGLTVIAPTIDATQLAANPGQSDVPLALPQNCITHTIAEGDTPFGIAAQYSANPFLMLEANGLTEETSTLLQIGDVLIVPLEGCPLDQLPNYSPQSQTVIEDIDTSTEGTAEASTSAEATEDAEGTSEATEAAGTPGATATITLAPTAANAQVSIVRVVSAGDVTAEGVLIRNNGNTVNVTGWTLEDAQGNEFRFGEQLIFSNTEVTVFTRAGQNTPIALFWGEDSPIWDDPNDVVTLRDGQGRVQATVRVSSLINLGN
jgi:hypothetical protein